MLLAKFKVLDHYFVRKFARQPDCADIGQKLRMHPYYASDAVDGNNWYSYEDGSIILDSNTDWHYLWDGDIENEDIINNNNDIADNLKKVAEALIPHAMKAVAGLYRLFWDETHGTLIISTTPVSGAISVDSVFKGTGSWSGSVELGSHTVSFGSVSGYLTPVPQSVTLSAGQTVSVAGTYKKEDCPVVSAPSNPIPAGGATNVSTTASLSWSPSNNATTYDI